jgi:redox-sensitive bicupin YhaK (pirin superfamily)
VRLARGASTTFSLPEGHTLALVVRRGSVRINGSRAEMALLERAGTDVAIEADEDATLLLLGGQPIDESIVGDGPFVMNSRDEIVQAIADFNGGRFGRISPPESVIA